MKKFGLLVLFFSSSYALAWGHTGHRTIAALAERRLCPAARTKVAQWLQGESLAEASTWADEMRDQPDYRYLRPWHFVTLPLDSHYQDAPKNPRGDLVTALAAQTPKLASTSADERLLAARMVIHLVGDAHQPLHAGEHEDGGGNALEVVWYGQTGENLHKVWDGGMIEHLGMRYPDLAASLDTVQPAVPQLDPVSWVNESSHYASEIYPDQTGGVPHLGDAYMNAHLELLKQRLREAGFRLAVVLNQAAGCN